MDPEKSPSPVTTPATTPITVTASAPMPRRVSRRSTIIGAIVALLIAGGLGWLAWDLTHPVPGATAGAGGGAGRQGAGPGGGGPGGGGRAGGGPGGRGAATTVGVAVAEKIDIPIVMESLGTVVPQATVRVRPQVSGVLQQLLFKEGQLVRKGELLATIDPRQFENALQTAIGQRQRDEAQLENAKVTLERFRTLLQQDSIARQEVDTQAALVKQLEGTGVIARANEGTARLNLSYTRIVAPIAGRVGLRTVDVGNVVSPGDASGVAVITQLAPIDVEFTVPQDQAPDLQQRSGAFMEARALDRTRANVLDVGVFASLDNQVDTQTGTVRAKARFDNAKQELFPNQFVNIRLMVRTLKDAIVVPVAALRRGNNGDHVFVLNADRTVSQRPVKAGQSTVDRVQIASGLQVGEQVVTEGADRLKDGARVTLPGDAPRGAGEGGGGRRRRGASAPADGTRSAPEAGVQSPAGGAVTAPADAGARPNAAVGATAPRGGASAPGAPAPREGGATPREGGATPREGGATPRESGATPREAGATPRIGAAGSAAAAARPAPTQGAAKPGAGPTQEQRKRFLESAADNPEQLERRKALLERIDKGDPAALERWNRMMERRREAGDGGGGGGGAGEGGPRGPRAEGGPRGPRGPAPAQ